MALKLTGVSHAPLGRTPRNQEEKPLPLLHLSVPPGPPLTKPNNMPAGKGTPLQGPAPVSLNQANKGGFELTGSQAAPNKYTSVHLLILYTHDRTAVLMHCTNTNRETVLLV